MAKLYFYYSSMNAGKSTNLLQASFNYRERGMRTMLWTAALDDRYRPGTITSRIGLEAEASVFGANTDLRGAVLERVDLSSVRLEETRLDLTGAIRLAESHGALVEL